MTELNTLKISMNCKHRRITNDDSNYQTGWCYDCVRELMSDIALSNTSAIHERGLPPLIPGVYFTTTNPLAPVHKKWELSVHQDGMIWDTNIQEYFGPIPFNVWKLQEPKDLEPITTDSLLEMATALETNYCFDQAMTRLIELVRNTVTLMKQKELAE